MIANLTSMWRMKILLKEALTKVVGVEEGTLAETIAQSILDWIDPDDKPRVSGAETSYYQNLTPPNFARMVRWTTSRNCSWCRESLPAIY